MPLSRPRSKLQRRIQLTREAERIAYQLKADIYHFHDPELIPAMRSLARRTGKPVIWDAHENYVFTISHFNQFGVRPISQLAARWFDRMELSACRQDFAGVVTITEVMAERYRPLGIRTCVLGNYVDIDAVAVPPRVGRSARPRLMSSGAQYADRGAFEIVDAFRLVRRDDQCELAMWGEFSPPQLVDELRRRAISDGIPETDVIMGGPYTWKILVEELIPTAWAGCVLFNPRDPNNRIGLPNRLFECWANKVPVIVTAGTEVARLVADVQGGFVVADNRPAAIANWFRLLACDLGLVEQLGKNGFQAVREKYNWTTAFAQLLAFYGEIADGKTKVT